MMLMNNFISKKLPAATFFLIIVVLGLNAQNNNLPYNKDSVIIAAKDIMSSTAFCALVTIDTAGMPQVRTMNPFPVEDDFVIWFATRRQSRKVTEINNNPDVSVYFSDHNNGKGYVNIVGKATLIDDRQFLTEMKREYWDNIPGWQDDFILIKIVPVYMNVINYSRGISNEPVTNKTPRIDFNK